jgi:hypothetical protein
LQADLI